MTATSTSRGHPVYYDTETQTWKYTDNQEPIQNNERPCPRCGHLPTPEGHDYCLGYIPGVKSACCGHGKKPGYIIHETSSETHNTTDTKPTQKHKGRSPP